MQLQISCSTAELSWQNQSTRTILTGQTYEECSRTRRSHARIETVNYQRAGAEAERRPRKAWHSDPGRLKIHITNEPGRRPALRFKSGCDGSVVKNPVFHVFSHQTA